MNIENIYNLVVKMGIENDPRGVAGVKKILAKEKEKFSAFGKVQKETFDQDKLINPYSDSRILFNNHPKIVKRVLAGIDISVSEMLLADWLKAKGKKIDLVISHHPLGRALANLGDVINLQADLLASYGVPINIAEGLLEPRVSEVGRKISPANHSRVIDAAKIIDISLMCTHTVCDNLVYGFLKKAIEKNKPETIEELVKCISNISEYKIANLEGAGVKIFTGKPERRVGKIALTEITGGTAGSRHIYEKLAQAGVGTIIGMHMDEEHKEEAEKYHLNVVIAGHISSDSLGTNLFLDELEKKGIEVIPCSGLIRVKRFK